MDYELKGEWWTAPAEGENDGIVMVTCRKDVDKWRSNPRCNVRVEAVWPYDSPGMPAEADSVLMQEATARLGLAFDRDPIAVLTGIHTGDGRRVWVFYTPSLHIFNRKFNEALAELPPMPISLECYADPEWEAYDEEAALEVN